MQFDITSNQTSKTRNFRFMLRLVVRRHFQQIQELVLYFLLVEIN